MLTIVRCIILSVSIVRHIWVWRVLCKFQGSSTSQWNSITRRSTRSRRTAGSSSSRRLWSGELSSRCSFRGGCFLAASMSGRLNTLMKMHRPRSLLYLLRETVENQIDTFPDPHSHFGPNGSHNRVVRLRSTLRSRLRSTRRHRSRCRRRFGGTRTDCLWWLDRLRRCVDIGGSSRGFTHNRYRFGKLLGSLIRLGRARTDHIWRLN